MRVVVIGAGLAGATAALAAREAGAEVIVVGDRPGATALWSGVAEVYGPVYDAVDHPDLISGPRLTVPGRQPLESLSARFDRLLLRRSFHPYGRLGLTASTLGLLSRRAAEVLDIDLSWPPAASFVANANGTVRSADGAMPSIWRGQVRPGREVAVFGFEHYPSFDPGAVANSLISQGFQSTPHWLDIGGAAIAQSPAEASAQLETLSDDALKELGATTGDIAAERLALFPPILGRSHDEHWRIWSALRVGARQTVVAELASVHKSLHGFRFFSRLSKRLDDADVTRRRGRVTRLAHENGTIAAIELDGQKMVELDRLVLATGRHIGGGLTRRSPFGESLLALPVYFAGAPLDPDQNPVELTTRRLFDDHPLFTVGLGVSPRLQPLDELANPAYDNLWAAGLVIGGTNFARDGSGFGVALITGYAAGRLAAGQEV